MLVFCMSIFKSFHSAIYITCEPYGRVIQGLDFQTKGFQLMALSVECSQVRKKQIRFMVSVLVP